VTPPPREYIKQLHPVRQSLPTLKRGILGKKKKSPPETEGLGGWVVV
jgi:hypothetical protein